MSNSPRETHELEEFILRLNTASLLSSLKANGAKVIGSRKKSDLIKQIGDRVLEIGITNFIDALEEDCFKEALKTFNSSSSSTSSSSTTKKSTTLTTTTATGKNKRKPSLSRQNLVHNIQEHGLENFLLDCDENLLEKFCEVLILDKSTKETMITLLTDEIMLTGAKQFLHNIPTETLKQWCTQLKLSHRAAKRVIVENFMCEIFQLEPLGEYETDGTEEAVLKKEQEQNTNEQEENHKSKSKNKRKKENNENSDDNEENNNKKQKQEEEEEEEKEKEKEKENSEEEEEKDNENNENNNDENNSENRKSRRSSKKLIEKKKYVSPPLSTIKKGITKEELHNKFNLTDLKEFCKLNNIITNGKKAMLIKRIVQFLETGDKEVPKAKASKRKRNIAEKEEKSSSSLEKKIKTNNNDDNGDDNNDDNGDNENDDNNNDNSENE